MLSLYRDSPFQTPPLIEKPDPGPDYAALVTALVDQLGMLPDGAGELMLSAEESAAIRRTGWCARAGLWRCPAIPWEFVALYPGLWHVSDHLEPACRSMPWHPKRAVFRRPGRIDPLGAIDHQLLDQIRSAPGSRLTRSQLHHRLSWRISARLLDHTLSRLLAQNWVTLAPDGWIYPNAGS